MEPPLSLPGSPVRRRLGQLLLALTSLLISAELGLWALPRLLHLRAEQRAAEAPAADPLGLYLLCMGDSVTAGDGVKQGVESWPNLLAPAFEERGLARPAVNNRAWPGEGSMGVAGKQWTEAEHREGGVALVMVGHNDFIWWEDILNGQQTVERPGLSARSVGWMPRLLRAAWFAAGPRRPASGLRPEALELFRQNIHRIKVGAEEAGMHLALLTYVVPGAPGPDRGDQAEAYAVVRHTQFQINDLIAQAAREEDLALIDLEALGLASAEWRADEFLDPIHPTPALHQQMARAVAAALQDLGWAQRSGG